MENKNYGEIFCQATEILAQHLIEKVSFDRTILCTIIDDSEKNIGKYQVQNAETVFDAYSGDTTYKKNDNVYVSIPGGDWNEQKIIVSKKIEGAQTAINYDDPYETFVNITNNIIPNNDLSAGLIANDDKEAILLWEYNGENSEALCKNSGKEFIGYNRLAIQASFLTLLKSLDVKIGEYGLDLYVEVASGDSEDTATEICRLNCADMIGNPYNYETYFPQTKIFNIEDVEKIVGMKLYFYQKKGSFKNSQEDIVSHLNTPANILVKDITVSIGYDAEQFDKDTLILFTSNSKKYGKSISPNEDNHKLIEVRWIHKFEDGRIKVVDENDDIDYNLTFYRYKLGAKSANVWSGVDWVLLSDQEVKNQNISYKVYDEDWKKYNALTADNDIPVRTPEFNSTWLLPDTNNAEEKVKVILTYNDNERLFGQIIEFSNTDEININAAIDAIRALIIVCQDESDGNYLLYRIDGKILDNAYSRVRRELVAYLNSSYEENDSILTEAESIEWIIPANNTMITLDEEDEYEPAEDGFYHVIKYGEKDIGIRENNNFFYTIKSSYNQTLVNNTIKCIVTRNDTTYTAVKEFTFGPAGTSGTDYTFVLDFATKENALTINGDKLACTVQAKLYDYTGKDITNKIDYENLSWDFVNRHNYIKDEFFNKVDNKVEIQLKEGIPSVPSDNYTILKATLDNWGDYKLEAYLPIPIRLNREDASYISGATYIRYSSLGYLEDSFRNPYVLYDSNHNIDNVSSWYINSPNLNDTFVPKLSVRDGEYTLRPVNIYVENSTSQVCVYCQYGNTILWSQPIYIYQNKYPTSIINDWNGELQIDQDGNAILAAKVVAGTKNSDNKFTGVMMGDWGNTDTENNIIKNTGIYGFKDGGAVFGFKDDGTAFIGPSDGGRLEFNGEKAVIKSSAMQGTNDDYGMLMDFDDGYIKLIQSGNKNNQIWIDAQNTSTHPLRIGNKDNPNFKVDWDGKATLTGAKVSGDINMSSGNISWDKVADNGAYQIASYADVLAKAIASGTALDKEEYPEATFINGDCIYTPNIIGGKITAVGEGNLDTYSTMTSEGFSIYHTTSKDKAKLEMLVGGGEDDNAVRIAIGAGETGTEGGRWIDKGRLILQKTYSKDANGDYLNVAKIYLKNNIGNKEEEIGFMFTYNGITVNSPLFDFNGKAVNCIGSESIDFSTSKISFKNASVDFTGATVTGLECIAVFG